MMTQSSICNPEYYWVQYRDKNGRWSKPTIGMLFNGLWYVVKLTWFYKDHDIYVLERIPDYNGTRRAESYDGQ